MGAWLGTSLRIRGSDPYWLQTANPDTPFIAFEYFPPRTEQGVQNLYERFDRMKNQKPLYMDVTWGAGGSTSDLTVELCKNMSLVGWRLAVGFLAPIDCETTRSVGCLKVHSLANGQKVFSRRGFGGDIWV